jgi:hypothetical protein
MTRGQGESMNVARVRGRKLADQTGGSFVIEKLPGAGGINAAEK